MRLLGFKLGQYQSPRRISTIRCATSRGLPSTVSTAFRLRDGEIFVFFTEGERQPPRNEDEWLAPGTQTPPLFMNPSGSFAGFLNNIDKNPLNNAA